MWLYACQQCFIVSQAEVNTHSWVTLPISRDQCGIFLHHEPGALDECLTRWSSSLLQTHFSFPGCCDTNDQSYTAVIKKSSLDLAGNKAGFFPAVPGFLIIARRSYSSNNLPYVVLVGWLSSILVVQIAGGGHSPLTFPPQLALPPQSQNVLVCQFPGRGSAHCDFSTTALGDNIHLFLKKKSPFDWYSINILAVKMSESIKKLHYPLRRWKGWSFQVGAKVELYAALHANLHFCTFHQH